MPLYLKIILFLIIISIWGIVIILHFVVPYSFILFIFDFWFVLAEVPLFLPERFQKLSIFEEPRYASVTNGIQTILALLVIVYYWDIVGVTLKNLWH